MTAIWIERRSLNCAETGLVWFDYSLFFFEEMLWYFVNVIAVCKFKRFSSWTEETYNFISEKKARSELLFCWIWEKYSKIGIINYFIFHSLSADCPGNSVRIFTFSQNLLNHMKCYSSKYDTNFWLLVIVSYHISKYRWIRKDYMKSKHDFKLIKLL